MGSGITRLLSPNQGSDLLHGLKISYHNIFPHNKVCVHRISCPRYITYSCFRLAAVPVIRSPGCLTKTRYHILNLSLSREGTVIWISSHFSRFVTQLLSTLSTPEGRDSDLYISFFCEKWGRRKRTKRNPVKGERYVSTSLIYSWQGSKHRVFRPIKHINTARTIDKPIHWKRNLLYRFRLPHRLK